MSDLDIAKDRADWLLDAVAGATQNRQFLRGDPAYDEVAGEAILLNGEKAINVALSKKDAEITRLRAALADAQAVGFAAGVEAAASRCVGFYVDIDERTVELPEHIRALTPPDATAAAARVLLDDLAKSHTDHPDAQDRWQKANSAMGGNTKSWLAYVDALRAIAGDTP